MPPSRSSMWAGPTARRSAPSTTTTFLVRYLLRPPLVGSRLSIDDRGRVQLALKKPFRDRTTHLAFEPLELIAHLASRVLFGTTHWVVPIPLRGTEACLPRPRRHLFTYHGVLAPGSSWRGDAVPAPPDTGVDDSASSPSPALAGSVSAPPIRATAPPHTAPYIAWADLLRRVFALDALQCDPCGGRRRVIACVTEPGPVRAILESLGLDPDPPRLAPARSPPELAFPD